MSEEVIYKAQTKQLKRRGIAPAGIIIAVGAVLLFANLIEFNMMTIMWPILFIVAPGLLLLWPAYSSTPDQRHALSFLAVPGSVLLALGGLLFTMNLFGHWESWAYAWVTLPAAVVSGVMYMNRHDKSHRVHQSGRGFIRIIGILGLVQAAIFELLIFDTLGSWWPIALIAFGVYMFIKEKNSVSVAN